MRPPGPLEIGLILVIILIVFGVGKLPQVGAAFGKGIRAFKRGHNDEVEEEEKHNKKPKKKKRAAKKVAEAKAEEKTEETAEVKAEEKTEEKA